jgi:hypothetical protein
MGAHGLVKFFLPRKSWPCIPIWPSRLRCRERDRGISAFASPDAIGTLLAECRPGFGLGTLWLSTGGDDAKGD